MAYQGEIYLKKDFFTEKDKKILDFKGQEAYIFKYDSGVEAIKLTNNYGYISVLPFMGMQIWDVVFNGRNLAMKTTFSRPVKTDFFLYTYGAFLVHCGALRMGCPGPEDNHPLHGELPCAEYKDVKIVFGQDKIGSFLGINGVYEYNIAFGAHYNAKPLVKIYRDLTILDISMQIDNLSHYDMELMYMAHVNLRPVFGGKIVQSLGWTNKDLMVRESIPSHIKAPEGFMKFIEKLKKDPSPTKVIKEDDVYRPEVVFSIGTPATDKDGFAHFMQVHPDGSADYVSYKPLEFDHGSRWFCINKDKKAFGLILPATADAEGYTAEKKKGNIKKIAGKGFKKFSVKAGYLTKKDASEKEEFINQLMTGP